ncbi:MAG: NIL domain-containing protein [Candidatus Nanopelagicales bacterium]|nr:NIL domain-containing protein [Candidatus Nanopelagicales bacterium]MDZ4249209.1 NIL domain-containing protein [Candidatus Nanopelagicales bacterium]MDZ7577420.1 NIL domain-containing protein [Candidatus Nanopelagicales bacterium]
MAEHLRLTFPENQVTEPVIYHLVKDYHVVPNIRRAAIESHFGWMVVELAGDLDSIAAAKKYLESHGIRIDSAEGDIVEG